MEPQTDNPTAPKASLADALKSWVMVALTLTFTLLYAAALTGWLKPLADEKMVVRLEPIIFVIIGYYFGRLPSQQNEKTLQGEIGRQTQKADANQHAKEQAQQAREALEEKVKNVRVVLSSPSATTRAAPLEAANLAATAAAPVQMNVLRERVATALDLLNS